MWLPVRGYQSAGPFGSSSDTRNWSWLTCYEIESFDSELPADQRTRLCPAMPPVQGPKRELTPSGHRNSRLQSLAKRSRCNLEVQHVIQELGEGHGLRETGMISVAREHGSRAGASRPPPIEGQTDDAQPSPTLVFELWYSW